MSRIATRPGTGSSCRNREDVLDGIGQAPGAISGLHRGENLGKRPIRLVAGAGSRDGNDGNDGRTDP
jgi:hypothetical protein